MAEKRLKLTLIPHAKMRLALAREITFPDVPNFPFAVCAER